jgi:hypothetical protein
MTEIRLSEAAVRQQPVQRVEQDSLSGVKLPALSLVSHLLYHESYLASVIMIAHMCSSSRVTACIKTVTKIR